jgi:hypothetical protein
MQVAPKTPSASLREYTIPFRMINLPSLLPYLWVICSTRGLHSVGSIDSSWMPRSVRSFCSTRGLHSAGSIDSSWIHWSARHCYCNRKSLPVRLSPSRRTIYPVLLERRIRAFQYAIRARGFNGEPDQMGYILSTVIAKAHVAQGIRSVRPPAKHFSSHK